MTKRAVQHSAASVEHYGPEYIGPMVREVFGGPINLDPASCEQANLLIGAWKYYTKADDGLNQPWFGNVYLNPPSTGSRVSDSLPRAWVWTERENSTRWRSGFEGSWIAWRFGPPRNTDQKSRHVGHGWPCIRSYWIMKLVLIESPYQGDVERNKAYARECLTDSLRRGEAPLASHLLYTQVLDDTVRYERELGIAAGFAWGKKADFTAVYTDLGITTGMQAGIELARKQGRTVIFRSIRPAAKHFQDTDKD